MLLHLLSIIISSASIQQGIAAAESASLLHHLRMLLLRLLFLLLRRETEYSLERSNSDFDVVSSERIKLEWCNCRSFAASVERAWRRGAAGNVNYHHVISRLTSVELLVE